MMFTMHNLISLQTNCPVPQLPPFLPNSSLRTRLASCTAWSSNVTHIPLPIYLSQALESSPSHLYPSNLNTCGTANNSNYDQGIGVTRRCGPLRGPSSSSCGGLRRSAEAFFSPSGKKISFYVCFGPNFGHFW